MAVWGILFLIIFGAAHYAVPSYLDAAMMWVAIGVIFLILNFVLGSKKKAGEGSKQTWMSLVVFAFIVTLVVALGYVALDVSWLMSLWLLIYGVGIYSEGQAQNMQMHTAGGLFLVIAALFVPSFGANYFLAGALFLGLHALIGGLIASPPKAK